jgi:hypothetical protein
MGIDFYRTVTMTSGAAAVSRNVSLLPVEGRKSEIGDAMSLCRVADSVERFPVDQPILRRLGDFSTRLAR